MLKIQNLRPNKKKIKEELIDLKMDKASFENSKAKRAKFLKKIRQLDIKREKIVGLIDFLQAAKLENGERIKRLEERICDLTQQLENALTVKFSLKTSSNKLETMLQTKRVAITKKGLDSLILMLN